jgi:predicted metal-binding membrane protein
MPEAAVARARLAILAASLAAVALAAWVWLVRASPHHAHAGFAAAVLMWQAMTIAMMAPTVLRWMAAFTALAGTRRAPAFAAGYFTVWLGYSVLAAGLQAALARAGILTHLDGRLPARAGGAVLLASGLLYFTPFSRACLRHCRNPLTYFLARWNNAPRGGFAIGATHGAYCVGCCWAVMLTAFAMGMMNLLWMAFLTVLMCVEKLLPGGDRIGAAAAAGMAAWGVVLLTS